MTPTKLLKLRSSYALRMVVEAELDVACSRAMAISPTLTKERFSNMAAMSYSRVARLVDQTVEVHVKTRNALDRRKAKP